MIRVECSILAASIGLMLWLCLAARAQDDFEPSKSPRPASVGLRIAVIDMEDAFRAHPRREEAETEIEAQRSEARKKFLESSAALKDLLERHQALMLADSREEAANVLAQAAEEEKKVAELKSTNERDLAEAMRTARRSIHADVQAAVKRVNALPQHDYHIVLDRSAASEAGIPHVVDTRDIADLTEAVKAELHTASDSSEE